MKNKKQAKKKTVKKNTKNFAFQMMLYKTTFKYELCKKECTSYFNFVKVTYFVYPYKIVYHMSIPKSNDYLADAKKEVKRLIADDTLVDYTLKHFTSMKEYNDYATC